MCSMNASDTADTCAKQLKLTAVRENVRLLMLIMAAKAEQTF